MSRLNHFNLGNEFHANEGDGTTGPDNSWKSDEVSCLRDTTNVFIIEKLRPDFQDLVERLHHLGFTAQGQAINGTAAIDAISEVRPDVVLMNVALDNNISGVPASEYIHKTYGIPVIFITTSSADELNKLADLPAGYGFIIKPFQNRELEIAINMAILRNRKERHDVPPATLEKYTENTGSDARKMESLGTLAGGIAHDFSNIIGAIIGYTQLSLLDVALDSQHKENLERVLQAGKRAKELVKQILIFSQRADRELKPVNVLPIVKEVLRFLRSTIPSTIEIQQDWQTPNTTILADPTEVYQLLINLCTNAANAMRDKGGRLEVSLSENAHQSPKADGSLNPEARPYLTIDIRDTGHGMDAATLPRIFEPYFTTKHQSEGAGMGLAVVHGIVNSYGGRIEVESNPRVGTLLRVHLPLYKNGRKDKYSIRPATGLNSLKVLFVDDEEALVSLGERMLARLGHQTTGFSSGFEALNAFQADPDAFDVVIADQTMPRMTGLELAKKMLLQRPDTPIILCTGLNRDVTPEQIRETGIKHLLLKPLVLEELADALESVPLKKDNADRSPHH